MSALTHQRNKPRRRELRGLKFALCAQADRMSAPRESRAGCACHYVPVSQLVMYSICSEVSVSIDIPNARSLRLAIS